MSDNTIAMYKEIINLIPSIIKKEQKAGSEGASFRG